MKLIDLTHTFESTMTVFPGMNPAVVEQIFNVEEHGYNVTRLEIITHMGTHLDCKSHVFTEGFTTSDKDINNFCGNGVVIDCSHLKANEEIGIDVLNNYDLHEKEFLLFYTGWDKYWNSNKYIENFPVISVELAQYLASINIKGIGLDVISIDRVNNSELSTHKIVLGKNKIIIENLKGLNELVDKNFTFMCLPLKIKDGDGSPIRAVAIIE
ncbi:cyclase family protein [Tepidibacter hydrothermalis]|uniref:Cyclase family protein n=1 Tax=Tepidibacter hydrothermalis TaxID=3036126 RepID=A0ABY8EIP5_9FIRM|nr:cyclase family protein [Tepidibacter hydrothermalis]WFD10723.1 cyclase family protein [Tepidibacter hydrothermalis]